MENNIYRENVEDIRFRCLKEANILCQHLNTTRYNGTYTYTYKDVLRIAEDFTKFVFGENKN